MNRASPWLLALPLALVLVSQSPAFILKPVPPEYQALVCDWYARYLGRPADPASVNFWGRRLMRGDSPREVEAAILGGREYFQRNGGNNIAYVKALFRDVLGTEPVGGQLEHWLHKLSDLEFRDDLAENFLKTARKAPPLPPPLPSALDPRPSFSPGVILVQPQSPVTPLPQVAPLPLPPGPTFVPSSNPVPTQTLPPPISLPLPLPQPPPQPLPLPPG